jgi:L-ascorbate metabolism protein UlaG (beta-lactamase superfamily)
MGPEDAAAALDLLRPRLAVPMHYNTWPVIAQDPARFAALAAAGGHAVKVLAPGATLEV